MPTIKIKVKCCRKSPLTKREMWKLEPGSVVYVEDLLVKTIPKEAGLNAAVIFDWEYVNPYDGFNPIVLNTETVVAVQPSAQAPATKYWYIEDYGKTWLAYRAKEV